MEALILSCSTGGGHNAAGFAIKERLIQQGHHATMMDPYELVSSRLAKFIGNVYIKIAQKTPRLFGFIYLLGEEYRKLPFSSPVYFANRKLARLLDQYLKAHPADVIIMPHLFPAEIITYMKYKGMKVPKTVFIATDYTCIPFTEETNCDYYVIPSKELRQEFVKRGIPAEKLQPFGIPARCAFSAPVSRADARKELGLSPDKFYLLVSGGSIGAGNLKKVIHILCSYLQKQGKMECIVICGNNARLYQKLRGTALKYPQLRVIASTSQMDLYLKACNIYLTKPGGLSSTEAAIAEIPCIHITPIPGCETQNRSYFAKRHMSIPLNDAKIELIPIIRQIMENKDNICGKIKLAQQKHINHSACQDICRWLEEII